MASWVEWAQKMISVYDTLSQELKDAYACLLDNKELIEELAVAIDAAKHVEEKCNNANSRRAALGIDILDYPLNRILEYSR